MGVEGNAANKLSGTEHGSSPRHTLRTKARATAKRQMPKWTMRNDSKDVSSRYSEAKKRRSRGDSTRVPEAMVSLETGQRRIGEQGAWLLTELSRRRTR